MRNGCKCKGKVSCLLLFVSFIFLFSYGYADLTITPIEDFLSSGGEGGPFSPSQMVYTLQNQGSEAFVWGLTEVSDWIDCSPEWGFLDPNESVDITVSIISAAESLSTGEYIEDVVFTDITNGVDETRQVLLNISQVDISPVAWWKLDGDVTDSSGNGHDGMVYGDPNWIIEGKIDGAIQLDGVEDYVEIDNYPGVTGNNPRTCSAWFKTNSNGEVILSWGDSQKGEAWFVVVDVDGTLAGNIWDAVIHGSTVVTDGQWHHVAMVLGEDLNDDGRLWIQDVQLYLDGQLETTTIVDTSGDPAAFINTSDNLDVTIGVRNYASYPLLDYAFYFNGLIDDIQLYARTLSQAEILQVAGIGPMVVSPVGSLDVSGEPGGPFTPAYQDYTLKNLGFESLYWGIDSLPEWVDVDSSFGVLDPNESTTVRVFLTEGADSLDEGLFTADVTFNNLSIVQDPVVRSVNLNIQTIGGIWTNPESFDPVVTEGTAQQQTLTIGNNGTELVNFNIRSRTVTQSAALSTPPATVTLPGVVPEKIVFDAKKMLQNDHHPNRLIVRFAPDKNKRYMSKEQVRQKLSAILPDAVVTRQYKLVPALSVIEFPANVNLEARLKSLNAQEDILYAQPDYYVHVDSLIPNDARFNELWGLHNTGQSGGQFDADIDAPEAWGVTTGNNSIIVAVIDTGVDYNHEDLAGNMWRNELEYNGTSGVDDDGNGYVDDVYGYDFCNNDPNPMDDHYHGTHCAGTIGAVGNNGKGVTGVCWDVKIMAIKFLDAGGGGWTSDAIECVQYATLMGADLSSNSWGGGAYDQGLKDAIDAAGASGQLFIAAAGNDSVDNDSYPHYPSSYTSDNLIAVLATDRNDSRSSFSNWGLNSVDIGAPGSSILSCEPGNRYQFLSGTSMATPHVAGACALLKSLSPSLTVSEIKDVLFNSVDTLSGLSNKCVSGGRMNVNNAISEISVPWITFEFDQGQVAAGTDIDNTVTFDASNLAPGLYTAEIILISDDPAHPQIIIPINMTVVENPLEVDPEDGSDWTGFEGGPFEPNAVVYTITNTGPDALDWTVQWQSDWIMVTPLAGTLEAGQDVDVLVELDTSAQSLVPGLYEDTLEFVNLVNNGIRQRDVTLTVRPPDKFTELFQSGCDLGNKSVTFQQDASSAFYAACLSRTPVTSFPVDPNEGTFIALADDDYAEVIFADGKQMDFYGNMYDRVYVGSNGYLTFGQGDTDYNPTLENHFSIPRIAPVYADLTPANNHCISYTQMDDRFVVSYVNIPVYGNKDVTSSFQVELFFADGTIRISYFDVEASYLIAGLSDGQGLPGIFEESDLSNYLYCCDCGDINGDGIVALSDLSNFALLWLQADCTQPDWCQKSDFDRNGQVDLYDWSMISDNWHKVDYQWSEPEFLIELNGKSWSEPIYFPELDDNQGNKAQAVSVSSDLLTVFFTRYVPSYDLYLLFQATRNSINDPFTQIRLLNELSQTGGGVGGPCVSADNQHLYYHETDPATGEAFIKMATWSEAQQQWIYQLTLEEIHCSGYPDYQPSLTEDELTIFFSSNRPDDGATTNIWTASRSSIEEPFTNLRQVDELDMFIDVAQTPCILPDGLTLYFNAMVPGGEGQTIFKVSRPSLSDEFSNFEKITFPGHGTMWEMYCDVSPGGDKIFFQDGYGTEGGGIWMISLEPDPTELPAGQPYLTADGLTMYYNRFVPELDQKCIIRAIRSSAEQVFGNEKILSELIQTGGPLGSPWLSSDGQRLYYHEGHPDTNESKMKVAVWSEVNSRWQYERTLDEIHYGPDTVTILASLTDDELNIYWCSTRPDGTGPWDIWTASRASIEDPFENVHEVEELNTYFSEGSPSISPDGLTLYYKSVLEYGSTHQIYKATRLSREDSFSGLELVNIPGFESSSKLHPYVSRNGNELYFETTTSTQSGCFRTELIPIQEPCLPR